MDISGDEIKVIAKSDLTHFHIGNLYVVEECRLISVFNEGSKNYKLIQNWED